MSPWVPAELDGFAGRMVGFFLGMNGQMAYYNLPLRQSYNIALHATSVLGSGYRNAQLLGLVTYEDAKGYNVKARHIEALPVLPAGTPRNAEDLVYLKLKTASGEVVAIAMDWIASAPEQVISTGVRATIYGAAPSDMAHIADVLKQNSYANVALELI